MEVQLLQRWTIPTEGFPQPICATVRMTEANQIWDSFMLGILHICTKIYYLYSDLIKMKDGETEIHKEESVIFPFYT